MAYLKSLRNLLRTFFAQATSVLAPNLELPLMNLRSPEMVFKSVVPLIRILAGMQERAGSGYARARGALVGVTHPLTYSMLNPSQGQSYPCGFLGRDRENNMQVVNPPMEF